MRRLLIILAVLAALAAAGFYVLTIPVTLAVADLPDHLGDAEAGKLVFHAGGCSSCHAVPKAEGEAKYVLAGGLELNTPFGVFEVPNISSHPQAGIGGWTDAQFVTAMQLGTSPEGEHYYPAFPYTSYARMTRTDVLDLHAYLRTLPASDNVPGPHKLGFPFNIRRGLGLWKLLNLSPDPVMPPSDDPVVARGQYLVEGPGHCSECHTPRDPMGGLKVGAWLSGAPNPDGPGTIPNITPHEKGVGGWADSDLVYYLETGFTPDFDVAGGQMVSVIGNISQLPESDRVAIVAYLRSIPALPGD